MDRHKSYTDMLMRHRTMVWRMCLRRARGDVEASRDLMQDVSLSLWEHFNDLRQGCPPLEERAWVYWHTRSVLDHMHRRQGTSPLPLQDNVAGDMAADDNLGRQELIDSIMASLSPDEQRMMRLRMEGYRADEIASIMGLNRDAVYQRIHRATAKARRAVLVLLLLLALSTVAVAVVPAWRKAVFGSGAGREASPADSSVAPNAQSSAVGMAQAEAATPSATPVLQVVERMPETDMQTVVSQMTLASAEADTVPVVAESLPPRPTVTVSGNRIVVSGIYGELVTLRNARGTKLSSQVCNGICVFTINAFQTSSYYQMQIGERPVIEFEIF